MLIKCCALKSHGLMQSYQQEGSELDEKHYETPYKEKIYKGFWIKGACFASSGLQGWESKALSHVYQSSYCLIPELFCSNVYKHYVNTRLQSAIFVAHCPSVARSFGSVQSIRFHLPDQILGVCLDIPFDWWGTNSVYKTHKDHFPDSTQNLRHSS